MLVAARLAARLLPTTLAAPKRMYATATVDEFPGLRDALPALPDFPRFREAVALLSSNETEAEKLLSNIENELPNFEKATQGIVNKDNWALFKQHLQRSEQYDSLEDYAERADLIAKLRRLPYLDAVYMAMQRPEAVGVSPLEVYKDLQSTIDLQLDIARALPMDSDPEVQAELEKGSEQAIRLQAAAADRVRFLQDTVSEGYDVTVPNEVTSEASAEGIIASTGVRMFQLGFFMKANLSRMRSDLAHFVANVKSRPVWRKFYLDPPLDAPNFEYVRALLEHVAALPYSDESKLMIRWLLSKNRMRSLEKIVAVFSRLVRARNREMDVSVITATAIPDQEKKRFESFITQAISAGLGSDPSLQFSFSVDSSLVGGYKLKIDDTDVDQSYQNSKVAASPVVRAYHEQQPYWKMYKIAPAHVQRAMDQYVQTQTEQVDRLATA